MEDTDADGVPDHLDQDDDGNGIPDHLEIDSDSDGMNAFSLRIRQRWKLFTRVETSAYRYNVIEFFLNYQQHKVGISANNLFPLSTPLQSLSSLLQNAT